MDRESIHRPCTFQSITKGVLMPLSRLTSWDMDMDYISMDEVYLEHAEALHVANLALEKCPTFGAICNRDTAGLVLSQKKKWRDSWSIYFVIGYNKFIREAKSQC
eukprot:15366332-Ditylum_brightwellii.AAC.1